MSTFIQDASLLLLREVLVEKRFSFFYVLINTLILLVKDGKYHNDNHVQWISIDCSFCRENLTEWTLIFVYLGMILIYSRITNKHISFVRTCTFWSKMRCSVYGSNAIRVVLWHHKVSINSIRGFLRHRTYRDIYNFGYMFLDFVKIFINTFDYAVFCFLRFKCSLNCTTNKIRTDAILFWN